ncbi:MAG: hypothetical protein KBC64_07070 [Simkaniaceae bacterium]|nr:hypothetical protein [Simkaniaceae bacterium]
MSIHQVACIQYHSHDEGQCYFIQSQIDRAPSNRGFKASYIIADSYDELVCLAGKERLAVLSQVVHDEVRKCLFCLPFTSGGWRGYVSSFPPTLDQLKVEVLEFTFIFSNAIQGKLLPEQKRSIRIVRDVLFDMKDDVILREIKRPIQL